MNRKCLRRRGTQRGGRGRKEKAQICKESKGNKPKENKVEIIHELN